jgi:hypothetical protein
MVLGLPDRLTPKTRAQSPLYVRGTEPPALVESLGHGTTAVQLGPGGSG